MESPRHNSVSLVIAEDEDQPFLLDLAKRCQLSLNVEAKYQLRMLDKKLCLMESGTAQYSPLSLDFSKQRYGISRKDHLCRAIGKNSRSVIDTTAGLGEDSVHLASVGLKVIAIERCSAIAALLLDAQRRITNSARFELEVIFGDSVEIIPSMKADVVYIDPMFPLSKKTAIPRQEMRFVRALAGNDLDVHDLFNVAFENFHRVVVKRPNKMEPLSEPVHHRVTGKTVNYDVYINNRIKN